MSFCWWLPPVQRNQLWQGDTDPGWDKAPGRPHFTPKLVPNLADAIQCTEMLHPQCHQERSATGQEVLTERTYTYVCGSLSIPWSRIPKWSEMEPPYHQCDQQSQQIISHCVQDLWPMSSCSEGLRILHPSEASSGICLSGMGPSLHQGCEKAGRHTTESSSIHH